MYFKHRLLGAALLVMVPVAGYARAPYGMAGCGLGSLVFGPENGQVSAATTNGTAFNQGFGISFGTSNCIDPTKTAALEAQQQFIADNYSTLSREMAQGDGETLRAFAGAMGCNNQSYSTFATQMQTSYARIFAAPGALAALDIVHDEVKANAPLAQQCDFVI